MKRKIIFVLLVALALTAILWSVDLAMAGTGTKPQFSDSVPGLVNYQGQVMLGGVPYEGNGFLKFAIVDASGTTTYWSNDGTSRAGGEPTAGISFTITEGVFTVLLGDTTLVNMTQPLPAAVFAGAERYLRTWFSIDGNSYQALSPDHRFVAVPYALQAQSAADADKLDGLDWADLMERFNHACPVGSTVRAVNADGSLVCQADAPLNRNLAPVANTYAVVDSQSTGRHTSITIGADGLGLIAYQDFDQVDYGFLKVAHCEDQLCSSASLTRLDSAGGTGWYTSVAIGTDGLGLITYFDETNDDLKVAHCDNLACTSATITTLDSVGRVGAYTSVAIGADGLGLIAYFDISYGDLKVAHCNDRACTSATFAVLDGPGQVGLTPSIVLGADGLALISYYDRTNQDLKMAHCNDLLCTSATISTIDKDGLVGAASILTIGRDGLGLMAYCTTDVDRDLKVAHCVDLPCTSATITTLDSAGEVGVHPSVAIGADGLGLISYQDWSHTALKVAHCNDLACTSASLLTLDDAWLAGGYSSITIGADGLGLISYDDGSNQALKVVHCGSAFCVDYFRQR